MPDNLTTIVATWNLEKPYDTKNKETKGHCKNELIRQKIGEVNADIWVLTETNTCICPGENFKPVHSFDTEETAKPGGNEKGSQKLVSIWHRGNLVKELETFDRSMAVCAQIEVNGKEFLVYGVVIPYLNHKGLEGQSTYGQEHEKGLVKAGEDWKRLRKEFPELPLIVAGDFNTTIAQRYRYDYGTANGRIILGEILEETGLSCSTSEITYEKLGYSLGAIDHICFNKDSGMEVGKADKFQEHFPDGTAVSDHIGVYARLH